MEELNQNDPHYIFEIGWEVCNKIGGIHTVLATKAEQLVNKYENNYILIGPDVRKDPGATPEFIEDPELFMHWRETALLDGLKFRVGKWNIPSRPVVILVDFTPYFNIKDKILGNFWETYRLDSLTGQWDYIEPALFGYAAAKVIENFYEHYLSAEDRILAHFHEWMTGSGILYLKQFIPQVGTVFTTHATVLGRSIAGNNMPLYRDLKNFDPLEISAGFGLRSKYSLEHTVAREADVFSTVSHTTAIESKYLIGRDPDIVTPNGFEPSLVPQGAALNTARNNARAKAKQVAEGLLNQRIDDNALLIQTSGRYEFRNKGIDVLIDSLGVLNRETVYSGQIVAFFMIPSDQQGVREEVVERIKHPDFDHPISGELLTHKLNNDSWDSILQRCKQNQLNNRPEDKVKIIFVPSYLNGNDGLFNQDYYSVLMGFDVTVFPSYYEPWGYTPLESIAFGIPTITTNLSGFGLWVKKKYGDLEQGVAIVERSDENYPEAVNAISELIIRFIRKTPQEREILQQTAIDISRTALWSQQIKYYYSAYRLAIEKATDRSEMYKSKIQYNQLAAEDKPPEDKPEWKKVYVAITLPQTFKPLQELANNLWWSWNAEAVELFRMVHPKKWEQYKHNPVAMIEHLSAENLEYLENNSEFLDRLNTVYTHFREYIDAPTKPSPAVAYFSMEYGLHDSIKIFSGGLGMLAGDYLKEASDKQVNIVGVGLLYRYGYFKQKITAFGEQLAEYIPQKFTELPLQPVRDQNGTWIRISLTLPGRNLFAKIWKLNVGRIPLYLMDTDLEENNAADRKITHQLYGGDWDNRFKQEYLLGIGGVRMLKALSIQSELFHINEGHAAFLGLERLRQIIQDRRFSIRHAFELVRLSSIFTTHTPVPAGHDAFHEETIRTYMPHYADRLGLSWEEFMNLGRTVHNDKSQKFSMSILAANLSQEMNGVSKIHGRVSRELFINRYKGFWSDELYIGHVTNGVHLPTWTHPRWQALYKHTFGEAYLKNQADQTHWQKIQDVQSEEIWSIRNALRQELIEYLRKRLSGDMTARHNNPKLILQTTESLNENALTIGFARRFATYKRAHLLFSNPERLAMLVNIPGQPVQFIFAGKAHPHDQAGQDLIQKIIEISRQEPFIGKIVFVEDYNMELGAQLTSGVDVWMNTPTRPLEASGTSGEKAVMNGVLNLSVLDGWWAEGYRENAGWALPEEPTYSNQEFQDQLDAETIYNLLEEEVIPAFYDRGDDQIPYKWVQFVKNCIAEIAPHYTMNRMLHDYQENFYKRMLKRSQTIYANDYKNLFELVAWKEKVQKNWATINVQFVKVPNSTIRPLNLGEFFNAEMVLEFVELSGHDVSVEILFGQKSNDEVKNIIYRETLKMEPLNDHAARYSCSIHISQTGVYDYAFRIRPQHPLLPHQQDMPLVKWV